MLWDYDACPHCESTCGQCKHGSVQSEINISIFTVSVNVFPGNNVFIPLDVKSVPQGGLAAPGETGRVE